jgi:hypothetical protein
LISKQNFSLYFLINKFKNILLKDFVFMIANAIILQLKNETLFDFEVKQQLIQLFGLIWKLYDLYLMKKKKNKYNKNSFLRRGSKVV